MIFYSLSKNLNQLASCLMCIGVGEKVKLGVHLCFKGNKKTF